MIFVTSDTHFGHAKVIEYCKRPFADVTEMNEALIRNWSRVVGNSDIVYHLGDFSFLPPQRAVAILKQLPGRIRLVPGNHDSKTFLNAAAILPNVDVLNQYVEISTNNRLVVLCHFPLESWKNMSRGSIHLHGHSHGGARVVDNRWDVGVDVQDYAPRPLEHFVLAAKSLSSRPDRRESSTKEES